MAYDNEINKYIGWIYIIKNTVNDKVYIGQTSVGIEHRWYQHKYSATREDIWSGVLYKAIRKYGIENFIIEQLYISVEDSDEELHKSLNLKEKYFIKKFNSLIPDGYNMTSGGENVSINKKVPCVAYYADGSIYKRFNSIIEGYNDVKNKNNCKNGSILICKCCNGELEYAYGYIWRYDSDDFHKYPLSYSQEEINRYHGEIPVKKYDLCGNLVNQFLSMKEACVSVGIDKYRSSLICECCKGKVKTAYGYVWRYLSDDFDLYDFKSNVGVMIDQYSLEGIFIKTFNTCADAAREINKAHANIIECCKGNKYSAYGFIWRYHGDNLYKYKLPNKKQKPGRKFKAVNQYSKNFVYIKTFYSSEEASLKVGCKSSSIRNACNRNGGGCNGYKWYYANDPNQPDKSKIIN